MNALAVQDPDTENRRGLNLEAFKLTTVLVTKLPLQRKISKVDSIYQLCKAWTDSDLYIVQKEEQCPGM
jgi:hypothetical protein